MLTNRLIEISKRLLTSFLPYRKQAKFYGVHLGCGTEIMSRFWAPSEPYLITIGDNCQITKDVKIFTHGGGRPRT